MFSFLHHHINVRSIFRKGALPAIRVFLGIGFLWLGFSVIPKTVANFVVRDVIEANRITAGQWIPDIQINVLGRCDRTKEIDYKHNGNHKKRERWHFDCRDEREKKPQKPCVTFRSTFAGALIYYEFSSDGDPVEGGVLYDGSCIGIPRGETELQAQAVHPLNGNWKSDVVSSTLKCSKERDESSERNESGFFEKSFGDDHEMESKEDKKDDEAKSISQDTLE